MLLAGQHESFAHAMNSRE